MRKLFFLSLSLMLLLFPFTGITLAAEQAHAEIPVVIDGGGTATMIPEVNSPMPVETTIHVDNGRTGRFYIIFTEPGVYHYTITAEFSENGKTQKADEVFHLTVEVLSQKDGSLYTVSTINSNRTLEKEDQVRFQKTPETTTQPRTPDTPPTTSGSPKKPGTPRTGDDSHLLNYVLIALASSAGLFFLALLYTSNTNKLIKED